MQLFKIKKDYFHHKAMTTSPDVYIIFFYLKFNKKILRKVKITPQSVGVINVSQNFTF